LFLFLECLVLHGVVNVELDGDEFSVILAREGDFAARDLGLESIDSRQHVMHQRLFFHVDLLRQKPSQFLISLRQKFVQASRSAEEGSLRDGGKIESDAGCFADLNRRRIFRRQVLQSQGGRSVDISARRSTSESAKSAEERHDQQSVLVCFVGLFCFCFLLAEEWKQIRTKKTVSQGSIL